MAFSLEGGKIMPDKKKTSQKDTTHSLSVSISTLF